MPTTHAGRVLPPTARVARGLCALVALGAAGALTGCAADRNARLEIGAYERLDIVNPDRDRAALQDGPSLDPTTASRAHWDERTVVAHVDGVSHQQTYTFNLRLDSDRAAARTRGEYPTFETALDDESDTDNLLMQALLGPFVGGAELALFPFFAIKSPPWTESQSPRVATEASEQTDDGHE